MSDNAARASYSPAFPLYRDADLIVQSSDGVFFATRALHLRSVSSVFDDILGLPAQREQQTKDGTPLLRIDEGSKLVELFLRYAQRNRFVVDGTSPKPEWETVLLLITMLDKYDAPLLLHSFLLEHLPRFIGSPRVPKLDAASSNRPLDVFALSAIHGFEDLTRRALECFHQWGKKQPGVKSLSHRHTQDTSKVEDGWRPFGLGDLDFEIFSKLSMRHIYRFSELHSKVVHTPGYTWFDAAKDFEVRSPSHRSLLAAKQL